MSHAEGTPSMGTPQDAPPGVPWPQPAGAPRPWTSTPGSPAPGPESPGVDPGPAGTDAAPQRRVIPAPTGPNWPLTVFGLMLVVVSLALVGYLLGYPAVDVAVWGPRSVSILGSVLVAIGVIGLITRRRR